MMKENEKKEWSQRGKKKTQEAEKNENVPVSRISVNGGRETL